MATELPRTRRGDAAQIAIVGASIVGALALLTSTIVSYWVSTGSTPAALYGQMGNLATTLLKWHGVPVEWFGMLWFVVVAASALFAGLDQRPRFNLTFLSLIPVAGLGLWLSSRRLMIAPAVPVMVATLAAFVVLVISASRTSPWKELPRHVGQKLMQLSRTPRARVLRGSALCRGRDVAGRLVDLVGNWSSEVAPAVVAFSAVSTISPTRTGDYCPLPKDQLVFLETAAAASAGGVSVVQLPNHYGELTPNSGLSALSRILGGKPIMLSAKESATSMRRLPSRTSSYYRMTFLPDAAEYDGTDRPVDVRTARSHVNLHVRSSVRFPDPSRLLDPATVLTQHGGYSRLQVRAAFFLGALGDKVKVVGVFEPEATAKPLAAAVIGVFDREGQLIARWTAEESELTRTPASAALVVPPGSYRVRVVGVDRRGNVGTIDSDFEAALDKAGPGRVSSLAAGVLEDGVFAPRLQFGSEASAVGQFELYDMPAGATASVTFALSRNTQSEPLLTRPAAIDVLPDSGPWLVHTEFPISALEPGDYVLRAAVTLNGEQIAHLVRTIRKSH